MGISAKLKSLRKQKGINQEEAAQLLGVSLSSYQKYERKKNSVTPSLEVLVKLADFYGVTMDYLLGREPAPPNPFEGMELNKLKELKEKSMIEKYMSFPPEIRAVLMDALVELVEATKPDQDEPAEKPTQMTAVKSVDLCADSDEDNAQTA